MTSRRFRRLRLTETTRLLVRETQLSPHDLIQPFFVMEGKDKARLIPSMPGIEALSIDRLLGEIESYMQMGGRAGLFFGIPQKKDLSGHHAIDEKAIIPSAIRAIKKNFPEFLVISDVCLCAYLKHGHCGVLNGHIIDNDATLPLLSQMATAHAKAGADFVAPSDMMDFRISHIRQAMDKKGLSDTGIISYAVKYASSFYGPFRDAVDSAPEFGDRKSYQMDYANIKEAVKEAQQDVFEGADIVMVKPALAYLDAIAKINESVNVPVAAYHVSGEYSMIKAASQKMWIDEKRVVIESLTSIKRAGAKIIFTYYAKEALPWIIANQ
ncbi:MAG: porphobilinogen synthase [Candidatus Omnitrophica bacterium]|nr:porphobilinogen synthase [Candidatus Omnitrophota bacterium]